MKGMATGHHTIVPSALSVSGNTGLSIWLDGSVAVIINIFTDNVLKALSIQVDERELLIYVVIVQLIWIAVETPFRDAVASFSATGLGWQYSNLTLVDAIGKTIKFLTFGMLAKAILREWSAGAFTVGQITAYGAVLLILFFAFFTKVKIMYGDMLGLVKMLDNVEQPPTV